MQTDWAHRNFPEPWASQILRRYGVLDFSPFFSASATVGDLVVRCPTYRAMEFLTKSGDTPALYSYVFDHDPVSHKLHSGDPCVSGDRFHVISISCHLHSACCLVSGAQGAFHSAEIPFFFSNPGFLGTRHEQKLSTHMATYLRNFAWSGNPNEAPPSDGADDTAPRWWPAFTNRTQTSIVLTTSPEGNISVTRCMFARPYACVRPCVSCIQGNIQGAC